MKEDGYPNTPELELDGMLTARARLPPLAAVSPLPSATAVDDEEEEVVDEDDEEEVS